MIVILITISNKKQVYEGMVNWKVTAATIYCDAVDDEVTVIVFKDWSARCTGYRKYGELGKDAIDLLKKRSRQSKRQLKCDGPACHRVIQYKEKLFSQEAKKGRSD